MNNWNSRKLLILIISIQIAVWGLTGLNSLGINLVVINQITFFIYVTFVPGLLILGIMKIRGLSFIEAFLFTIGLSLAIGMLIGFISNYFYPFVGISQPLSKIPLIISYSVFDILLIILNFIYLEEYNFVKRKINVKSSSNKGLPIVLYLLIILILSILGPLLLHYCNNNIIQITLIFLIGFFSILVAFKKIPSKYYLIGIFTLSLALLYHTSLISTHIWGADIHHEYYLANSILEHGFWDPHLYDNTNAMLSIGILASVYSILMNLNIVWLFKIIYPFIFSLVPVGLYFIYEKQLNQKIAFFSCFFFISFFAFYSVMPGLARQEIAEFFLTLMLVLMVSKNIDSFNKTILLIIFGCCLVVSHYGTSYIFLLSMIVAWFIAFSPISKKLKINTNSLSLLKSMYPLILIVFAMLWYIYISNASVFETAVKLGNNIFNSLSEMLSPTTSQAMDIALAKLPYLQSIERYLHLATQNFILIGIVKVLYEDRNGISKINDEFKVFSLSSFTIALAGVILPFFASAMNSDRLYGITLLFLAPFCIKGLLACIEAFNAIFKYFQTIIGVKNSWGFISVFFTIYLIFNSSLIYEVFQQPKIGRFALNNNIDFAVVNSRELRGIRWLKDNCVNNEKYADVYRGSVVLGITKNVHEMNISDIQNVKCNDVIFLGTYNLKSQKILVRESWNTIKYVKKPIFQYKLNEIYYNDGSSILLVDGEKN